MADVIRYQFGTKAALVYALSQICPGASVEEWFEYGGDPYYFRIILDITENRNDVPLPLIERLTNGIRSARSVLEQGAVIFKSRNDIIVSLANGYLFFNCHEAGTIETGTTPSAAISGNIEGGNINFGANSESTAYNARACGTLPGSLL